MKRLEYGKIKALLHFDYPYFGEPGDGCGDEIGVETWTRQGNTKFVGTEIPNDVIVDYTPRFGYRCAQFAHATDCLRGTNSSGIWNLSSNGEYEIEMFIRLISPTAGNILALRNNSAELFVLSKNASNQLALVSGSLGLDKTATKTVGLKVWSHIVVRLSSGTARVFLDGNEVFSQAMTGSATLAVSEVCLGGFVGQMDEFIFRHFAGAGTPTVPVRPYQGVLGVQKIGGFGNGKMGNIEISAYGQTQINSYAKVEGVIDTQNIIVSSWKNGIYGLPVVGDELMLIVVPLSRTKKGLRRV